MRRLSGLSGLGLPEDAKLLAQKMEEGATECNAGNTRNAILTAGKSKKTDSTLKSSPANTLTLAQGNISDFWLP